MESNGTPVVDSVSFGGEMDGSCVVDALSCGGEVDDVPSGYPCYSTEILMITLTSCKNFVTFAHSP